MNFTASLFNCSYFPDCVSLLLLNNALIVWEGKNQSSGKSVQKTKKATNVLCQMFHTCFSIRFWPRFTTLHCACIFLCTLLLCNPAGNPSVLSSVEYIAASYRNP
ncbi:hypothetical protein XELAEV_18017911mg [Xenopus laevis]|uniref:Uncharacterized protein n=1 Tax=Xenopus laevis TaxID=8355 RepID=A0A974DDA3_XENLA|nr:hypothetical protein XELAEV_18017911mg [Xenopus laevis]